MNENNIQIANTIIQQIGGQNRLKAMIGAKNFIAVENGLRFMFPRSNGINSIKVSLNGLDLYDVSYEYVTIKAHKIKAVTQSIYSDMLKTDIEQNTKLYLSL